MATFVIHFIEIETGGTGQPRRLNGLYFAIR